MTLIVNATITDGLLVPDVPLNLPAQSRVRLVVEPIHEAKGEETSPHNPLAELEKLCRDYPIHSGGERLTREQLHERP
jgi:hypothetical protein